MAFLMLLLLLLGFMISHVNVLKAENTTVHQTQAADEDAYNQSGSTEGEDDDDGGATEADEDDDDDEEY